MYQKEMSSLFGHLPCHLGLRSGVITFMLGSQFFAGHHAKGQASTSKQTCMGSH